jgi:hypothetical protein
MTWQEGTTAATRSAQDLLNDIIAIATSRHVSAADVNTGGSGYVVGDLLTYGAGGMVNFPSVYEVTTVSSGAVTGIRIRQGGAEARRLTTVTINAAGSGYAVDDVVVDSEILSPAPSEPFRVRVTSVGGSGDVTGIAIEGSGGNYYASGVGTTTGRTVSNAGPTTAAGTGLTLDVTFTTDLGLSPTNRATTTDGSGTGCTIDVTFSETGWTVLDLRQDGDAGSVNSDEVEVIMQGTVAGGNAPVIGARTWLQQDGPVNNYGIGWFAIDDYNPLLRLPDQPTASSGGDVGDGQPNIGVVEAAREYYISVNGRRIVGALRTTDVTVCWQTFYVGLMNSFATNLGDPYPMFVGGSQAIRNQRPDDSNLTGLSEAYIPNVGGSSMFIARAKELADYRSVANSRSTGGGVTRLRERTMYPMGFPQSVIGDDQLRDLAPGAIEQIDAGSMGDFERGSVSGAVLAIPGTTPQILLWPLTVVFTVDNTPSVSNYISGELDGVYWSGGKGSGGTDLAALDVIEQGGIRYRVFGNGTQLVTGHHYQNTIIAES